MLTYPLSVLNYKMVAEVGPKETREFLGYRDCMKLIYS